MKLFGREGNFFNQGCEFSFPGGQGTVLSSQNRALPLLRKYCWAGGERMGLDVQKGLYLLGQLKCFLDSGCICPPSFFNSLVYLQVKGIALHPELFSIDNGLLTPTMKAKRPELRNYFRSQIDELYSTIKV